MVVSEKIAARKQFWKRGEPWVWITGGAASLMLLLIFILIILIATKGLATFWPAPVTLVTMADGSRILGEKIETESDRKSKEPKIQFKIGNRDIYGLDFRWLEKSKIATESFPPDIMMVEREEYGNFYGYFSGLKLKNIEVAGEGATESRLRDALQATADQFRSLQIYREKIAEINARMQEIETAEKKAAYYDKDQSRPSGVQQEKALLQEEFNRSLDELTLQEARLTENTVVLTSIEGTEKEVALGHIVRVTWPNRMSSGEKTNYYFERLRELFFDNPRESNTEGGLYPAIFGTIMLVFLMTFSSFPLGVITGIYLREYAKDGPVVRIVRIAVNNLAGIPSIVYGIFGLGFFIYGIGSRFDSLVFPEYYPEPVFGTGGIMWASLTLGILTIPVVIVSVEESLGSIPKAVRESSLALGATQLQTLMKILLPMASPGIMTGFILAMARAAGEVAPLMITGVVKLAPTLPLDGSFPFLHLDRKFMHLGFHIYDISSQSPNVEAAKPMVYVTTLLLILIVLSMSGAAIYLRNRMKKSFTMSAI